MANTAVQAAVPLILAALARNSAQPEGAQALHEAVKSDHDGSILDNLMGYLGAPEAGNGAGILGHVLGGQRPAVEGSVAQVTGLDQGSAGSLMEMLAPVVMGAVGRTQQESGLDPSGLGQVPRSATTATADRARNERYASDARFEQRRLWDRRSITHCGKLFEVKAWGN